MSVWSRLASFARGERREGTVTLREPGWMLSTWGRPTAAGVSVTPESALRQTTVFRCVRILAETVATLPLHLYERAEAGDQVARRHPLYDLLHEQPNELMTSADMIEMMMVSMLMRGDAFVEIRRDWRGVIVELVPLLPNRVEVRVAPSGRELLYVIDGGVRTLHTGEVWHVRGFTLDGIHGVSPITYNRETIGLAVAAEQHGAHVFAQAAMPSGVLTYPGKLKQEARDNLAKSWQGFSQAGVGKVAVLEEGVTWKGLTMSAQDTSYIETRRFQKGEIAMIFGVPPHKVGDLGRATWSNIEQQNISFVQDTLRAWIRKLETTARRDLLLPSERHQYFAEFSLEGLLRGDTLTRSNGYEVQIRTGILSPNEARRLENRPPYDGGNEFVRPLNMSAVPPQTPAAPALPPPPTDQGVDDGNEI